MKGILSYNPSKAVRFVYSICSTKHKIHYKAALPTNFNCFFRSILSEL